MNEMMAEELQSTTPPKECAETPKGPLSPQALSEIIEVEKLSVRAAAAEIGIAHITLLRYLNSEMKRYNKDRVAKLTA